MIFLCHHHHDLFFRLGVDGDYGIPGKERRQFLPELFFRRLSIYFNTYKKAILRGVDMLAKGHDVKLFPGQDARYGGYEPDLVLALNNDNHSNNIGIMNDLLSGFLGDF